MKNYILNLIKTLIPILIIYILNYLIIFILSLIYISLNNNNLEQFINEYLPYLLIPYFILVILIIKHKYKYKTKKIKPSQYYLSFYLGVSLSTFLNMVIFLIIEKNTVVTTSLITSIISSSIVGPIFEEYIFRYYLLNSLKTFNNTKISILIGTLIFAIVHTSLINIIYAFILGLFLNLTYHKYNNINTSIILHVGANLIAIFLTQYNNLILILSIINLLVYFLIFIKNKNQFSLHL